MKPKDCFGVVIRSLGILTLIGSILYFYSMIDTLLAADKPHTPAFEYFIAAVVLLIAGLYLLRGAPHLMRFAYPKDKDENPDA